MRRLTAALILLATTGGAMATDVGAAPSRRDSVGASLTPFQATYSVTRGRLRLGEMKSTLQTTVDGVWRYQSDSETTGFVALFRQITIDEQSTFRVEDGQAVSLTHAYRMGGSRKNRDFSLEFDWETHEVRGIVRGEAVTEAVGPGAVDRHTAPLTVALAVAGARDFPFDLEMMDRGRTRHYHATLSGEETLNTEAGEIATVRVLLVRADDHERQFRFWFAPALDYVPVRIQSDDDSGKTVTLQLISYTPA